MSRVKASANLKELVLLYVEDETAIRETFSMMVERYFKKIYTAPNGKEGLEIFKNNKIDIIISDIKMPVMTGLDMAREIKNIHYEVPIIFTTAFGDSEYLKQAIDVGVDGYIIKPIDRNKVFERLNILSESIVAKAKVFQYSKLIETLFDYQRDGLVLLDEDLNIKLANKTFKLILKEANIKETDNINDLLGYCQDGQGIILSKQDFLDNLNSRLVCQGTKSGKYFDVDIRKIENYILLNFTDITEYTLKTKHIQESAMIDSLTKLYNRKKIEILKDKLIDNDLCLIMFDIDNFKKINDTYGHLKGDEVLQELAKVVKKSVRESDLVIRWGGEEFVVILQGLENIGIAKTLAEKLRLKICEIEIEEVGHFSCSFGVSCGFIETYETIETILNQADEALYKAKRSGKNRVEIFEG